MSRTFSTTVDLSKALKLPARGAAEAEGYPDAMGWSWRVIERLRPSTAAPVRGCLLGVVQVNRTVSAISHRRARAAAPDGGLVKSPSRRFSAIAAHLPTICSRKQRPRFRRSPCCSTPFRRPQQDDLRSLRQALCCCAGRRNNPSSSPRSSRSAQSSRHSFPRTPPSITGPNIAWELLYRDTIS